MLRLINKSGLDLVDGFIRLYGFFLSDTLPGKEVTVEFRRLHPSQNDYRDIMVRLNNSVYISPEEVGHLGLTDPEIFAALAHEVGHIIYKSHPFRGDFEQRADSLAHELGLGKQMINVIEKIIICRRYRDIVSQLVARIQYLQLLEKDPNSMTAMKRG